jgi:hypothetical protein
MWTLSLIAGPAIAHADEEVFAPIPDRPHPTDSRQRYLSTVA